jgi:hypothetical protein
VKHIQCTPRTRAITAGLRVLTVYSGHMRWLGAHRGLAFGKQHVARLELVVW